MILYYKIDTEAMKAFKVLYSKIMFFSLKNTVIFLSSFGLYLCIYNTTVMVWYDASAGDDDDALFSNTPELYKMKNKYLYDFLIDTAHVQIWTRDKKKTKNWNKIV